MSAKGKISKLNARIKLLEGGDFYNKSQETMNSQSKVIRALKSQLADAEVKLEKWHYCCAGLSILLVLAMIAAGDNLVEFVMGIF
jgi:hypothetical protein